MKAAKFWAQGSSSGSEASSDDDSEVEVVQQRTGKFAMSDSSSGTYALDLICAGERLVGPGRWRSRGCNLSFVEEKFLTPHTPHP